MRPIKIVKEPKKQLVSERIERYIQSENVVVEEPPRPKRPLGSKAKIVVAKMIAGISLVALVVTIGLWLYSSTGNESVYVYFEIKAIDSDGHPIAGAKVKNNSKALGSTDSFGEWRQYLLVEPGANFKLGLSKEYFNRRVFATKNIVIPMKDEVKGNLEVIKTIELKSTKGVVASNKGMKKAAGETLSNKKNNQIWFEFTGEATKRSESIRVALQNRARKLGLIVKERSPRKVMIGFLKTHDQKRSRILQVKIASEKNNKIARFLKNDTGSPLATARAILWGVKLHLEKAYPVSLNNSKWYLPRYKNKHLWSFNKMKHLYDSFGKAHAPKKAKGRFYLEQASLAGCESERRCLVFGPSLGEYFKSKKFVEKSLRIYGGREIDSVFVSGFAAQKIAPSLWRYYGKKKGKAPNVTLVSNQRIVHRQRAIPQSADYSIVSVPGKRFSKTSTP